MIATLITILGILAYPLVLLRIMWVHKVRIRWIDDFYDSDYVYDSSKRWDEDIISYTEMLLMIWKWSKDIEDWRLFQDKEDKKLEDI